MPPKAKFTADEIVDACIEIVESDGIDALTARNLGAKLGSSARPIFTVFDDMAAVGVATMERANRIYTEYVEAGLAEALPFKGVGENYIGFARERPQLFRLLFMKEREHVPDVSGVLRGLETGYDKIVQSIVASYGVSCAVATALYLHMWIYTHGIAVLIATNVCEFTDERISQMLTEVFTALLIKAQKGEFDDSGK